MSQAQPATSSLDFQAPDSGPGMTPYCCSFHWFRLPDGRIAGLDMVRSDNTGQIALRTFLVENDGSLRAMVQSAPKSDWAPFATESVPSLSGPKPVLGRGKGWIAGSVQSSGRLINRVAFDLKVVPQTEAHSTGELWQLHFVNLAAIDYPLVRTTGWLELDGVRYDIHSEGTVSIHLGNFLPDYAYCATVRDPGNSGAPGLLLASVDGEDLRVLGKLFRKVTFTYAFGEGGVPHRMFGIGSFQRNQIPLYFFPNLKLSWIKKVLHDLLGLQKTVRLSKIQVFVHELLSVKTITATAEASLHLRRGKDLPLGRVVLDYRGQVYTDNLIC